MTAALRPVVGLQVLAMLLAAANPSPQTANEYDVKAAFLYKFASFVEWPLDSTEVTCIAVVGQDPFGGMLEEVVKGKLVGARSFSIKRMKSVQEAVGCRIVFISLSERGKVRLILEQLRGTSSLTVSDIPDFCRDGGMVGFQLLDQKVRFGINTEAAERAHLKVSSKLLSVAVNVRQGSQ